MAVEGDPNYSKQVDDLSEQKKEFEDTHYAAPPTRHHVTTRDEDEFHRAVELNKQQNIFKRQQEQRDVRSNLREEQKNEAREKFMENNQAQRDSRNAQRDAYHRRRAEEAATRRQEAEDRKQVRHVEFDLTRERVHKDQIAAEKEEHRAARAQSDINNNVAAAQRRQRREDAQREATANERVKKIEAMNKSAKKAWENASPSERVKIRKEIETVNANARAKGLVPKEEYKNHKSFGGVVVDAAKAGAGKALDKTSDFMHGHDIYNPKKPIVRAALHSVKKATTTEIHEAGKRLGTHQKATSITGLGTKHQVKAYARGQRIAPQPMGTHEQNYMQNILGDMANPPEPVHPTMVATRAGREIGKGNPNAGVVLAGQTERRYITDGHGRSGTRATLEWRREHRQYTSPERAAKASVNQNWANDVTGMAHPPVRHRKNGVGSSSALDNFVKRL